MKVLFSVPIKEEQVRAFEKEFPTIECIVQQKEQPIEEILPDLDIWVTYGFDVEREHIERAENLKWIMVYSAGVDKLPREEILERNILVTNVTGIHKHSIAEQVFAYILSQERRLKECLTQQNNKVWNRKVRLQSIYGKTIGIIGVGAIGQEIARKAKAFDMKVLGIRKKPKDTEFVDEIFPIEKLHEVLRRSDFVVMVLPLTEETRHIMDKKAFLEMPRHGFFINIARGEIVDTNALIWAIQEDIIAGAALDVFEEEPLPKDHPLWTLENLIITPHTSGLFPDYISRSNKVFNHNLGVYINNKGEMMNVIDLQKGY